jgi:flagellin-like hook-associated protein FlgL
MSRIGASISGLDQLFLTHLQQVDDAALESAIRLATGKQVPRPSFDPSAFVLISSFESRLNVLESVKQQVDIAANIGSESQLALDQVRTQLTTIRDALLLDEDQSLNSADRDAQQAIIDAAIEEVGTLAGTEINGRRYLDGSVNYTFAGKNHLQIHDIQVFALAGETKFSGSVTSTATKASETYTGDAGGNIDTGDATFTLTGERGSAAFSVTDGEALTAVRDRINQESHNTGIAASAAGDTLTFTTVDFGDDATIDVNVTSGAFSTTTASTGQDAVVTINGKAISDAQVDGNRVSYLSNGTHVSFEFRAGFTGNFSPVTVSDGAVAKFSLTPDINRVTKLGLPGVHPELLGGVSGRLNDLLSGGALSGLSSNTSAAIRVIDEALGQLTLVEGRVDAFADVTVASSSALLSEFTGEVKDALSEINGVNEDEESLKLAKNQTLASSTLSALAIVQQQQFNVLGLVQLLAGI